MLYMKCEMCGKEAKLRRALIEGAEMMVCEDCSRYGIILPNKKILKPKKKPMPYSKDVFEEMDKELVPNWGRKIKMAREAKGMTREEFGAKLGEKTTTVAKIENEELRPTDETVKKIEKVLEIKLFQEIAGIPIKKKSTKPLTIGDILKIKNDKN